MGGSDPSPISLGWPSWHDLHCIESTSAALLALLGGPSKARREPLRQGRPGGGPGAPSLKPPGGREGAGLGTLAPLAEPGASPYLRQDGDGADVAEEDRAKRPIDAIVNMVDKALLALSVFL